MNSASIGWLKKLQRTGFGRGVALVSLGYCLAAAAPPAAAQETGETASALSISEEVRPLLKALDVLMARHPGLVVTYEDPRYRHPSELEDITEQVRPGTEPRILMPRHGSVSIQYQPLADAPVIEEQEALLSDLVEAYNVGDNPGRFRIDRSDDILHVVPHRIRGTMGEWVAAGSVLDRQISLLAENSNGLSVLIQICEELSRASGQDVQWGVVPTNLFANTMLTFHAVNESARSVLVRFLGMFEPVLTWQLNYSPMSNRYFLNVRAVSFPENPGFQPEDEESRPFREGLPEREPTEGGGFRPI